MAIDKRFIVNSTLWVPVSVGMRTVIHTNALDSVVYTIVKIVLSSLHDEQ